MSLPRETLAKYITPGCVFVETGSRWGDQCIEAVRLGAHAACGCESDPIFAAIAQLRAEELLREKARSSGVWQGPSVEFLRHNFTPPPSAGAQLVVFLDAHTDTSNLILEELDIIRGWNRPPNVILVDDMRLFRSSHWHITEEQIVAAIMAIGDYDFTADLGIEEGDILVARHRV